MSFNYFSINCYLYYVRMVEMNIIWCGFENNLEKTRTSTQTAILSTYLKMFSLNLLFPPELPDPVA